MNNIKDKFDCDNEKFEKLDIWFNNVLLGKTRIINNARELLSMCIRCKDKDSCTRKLEFMQLLDKMEG